MASSSVEMAWSSAVLLQKCSFGKTGSPNCCSRNHTLPKQLRTRDAVSVAACFLGFSVIKKMSATIPEATVVPELN